MGLRNTFSTTVTDITRNNTVYVESLNSFPTPVDNIITLVSFTHYIFTQPINTGINQLEIPDDGAVQFSTTNAIINFLSTDLTGTTPLFFGNITRLTFNRFNILSNNSGGHCFNLSNATGPGFVSFDQVVIQGFDSIGTIEGCSLSSENVGFVLNDAGLTLNDMLFIIFREASFTSQGGNHLTLTGTLIGAIFEDSIMTPASGAAFLDIDSSIALTDRIIIIDNLFSDSAGGTLFDAAGLDHTDPQIVAFNNGNEVDSNWAGEVGFKENATVTTIATVNTLTDISGTMVAGDQNERVTQSGGVLTYAGKEDIKAVVAVDLSMKRDIPASSSRTVRAVILVDSGSGYVTMGGAAMSISGVLKTISFSRNIFWQEADKVKCQIKNETNADDILVVDYNLSVKKL